MDTLQELLGLTVDIAAHRDSSSWHDLDVEGQIVVCVSLGVLFIGFVLYMMLT